MYRGWRGVPLQQTNRNAMPMITVAARQRHGGDLAGGLWPVVTQPRPQALPGDAMTGRLRLPSWLYADARQSLAVEFKSRLPKLCQSRDFFRWLAVDADDCVNHWGRQRAARPSGSATK